MKTQQAIISFAGGVMSPRASLRADLEQYSESLTVGKNVFITPQGGAVYREGMRYIDEPVANELFRVFQFHQGGDESDILVEVTAGGIRFRQDGVLLAPTGTNDYLLAELPDVQFVNQEELGILVHENHPPLYIERFDDGSITVAPLEFAKIPQTAYADSKTPSKAGGDAVYNITFTNFTAPYRYTVEYNSIPAETGLPEPVPQKYAYSGTPSIQESAIFDALNRISFLQGNNTQISLVSHLGSDEYQVTITGDNAGLELALFAEDTANSGPIEVTVTGANRGDEPAWSFPYVVLNDGNYYRCDVPHVSEASNEPGTGGSWTDFWTDLGATAPAWWAWQHDSDNDWVVDTVYAPWDRGFPSVAALHQQRLIFAANKDKTTSVWGSRIGVYDDFVGGSNSSDPFEFALDTSDAPKIKWIESQLNLVIGTSSGDWNLTGEITLGPNDISAVRQNYSRSHRARPVVVDTEVFYIEQGRTKLRSTRYVRDYNSFSSTDVSLLAENLIDEGITRLAMVRNPEPLLFMLREDGQVVVAGIHRTTNRMPWTELETTGNVLDLCAYYDKERDEDVIYLVVNRNGTIALEEMPYPARNFTEDAYWEQGICHMDSWVTGTVDQQTLVVPERFNGQAVGVLVGDSWYGENEVVTGRIFIPDDRDGETFIVGYIQQMEMITQEPANGFPGGIAFGTKRRWAELFCRVLDSSLPRVDGILPPDRSPQTSMGTPEVRRDGLRTYRFTSMGHDDGSITITQDRPYPLHVVGLFGKFTASNT